MGYSSAQAKAFIAEIAPLIQKYASKYGYQVCSPIIAQAVCESGITSTLAVKYHNYFGLKAGSSKKGALGVWDGTVVNMATKEEYTPGVLSSIKDYFRVYPDMEQGVHGYFEFIGGYNRYNNLKACCTPRDYLQTIKADGYCTSNSYVETCMNIINKYDLIKYDNMDRLPTEYVTGKTYCTHSNLKIRKSPNGEQVLYDDLTVRDAFNCIKGTNDFAILKRGTIVTSKGIETLEDGSKWMHINPGFICASMGENVYIL